MVLGGASSRRILLVNVVEFPNQSAVGIPEPEQVLDDNFFGRRVDRQPETCHRFGVPAPARSVSTSSTDDCTGSVCWLMPQRAGSPLCETVIANGDDCGGL